MVFYAAWGNVAANISTIISTSGIAAGQNSALCQFQSFIIQMFMPADALWTFCMACNVYLTFRHRYTARDLRKLEWKYILLCNGIPFIPAIIYVFLKPGRGRIYGPATLWCWVAVEWNVLRLATFYGPVWIIFLVTALIYVTIGAEIYKKRQQLRSVAAQHDATVYNTRRSEIHILSEISTCNVVGSQDLPVHEVHVSSAISASQSYPHNTVSVNPTHSGSLDPVESAKPKDFLSGSDAAAWAYTKCAMLFFAALIITWVPSTCNRVYTLVWSGEVNFTLCYIEALVLPLQGFWNAMIYITTSLGACRELWQSIRRLVPVPEIALPRAGNKNRSSKTNSKSESMTELARL